MVNSVAAGRAAYSRGAWREAYEQLSSGSGQDPEDLERLAVAAFLIGRADEATRAWEAAHHGFVVAGQTAPAVRCAFYLGLSLAQRGEHARGGGWIGRAARLLDDQPADRVERGYLLLAAGVRALSTERDPVTAYATFSEAVELAKRFDDPDLLALGRLGQGQGLAMRGRVAESLALLDEVMVAVTAGEISPVPSGIVYCAVIVVCQESFDLSRAQEWTAALSRWCAAQPDLRPYRGQCLVHRSEIMQLRGEWQDAFEEVRQACEHLADPPGDPVLGMARYQQAELLRLRGEPAAAERAYRQAADRGHPVHPGLALLRLAQGRVSDAMSAIHRVLAESTDDRVLRARVLGGYVEIALAAGEQASARSAVTELGRIAEEFGSAYLRAVAGYADGAVRLAEGDAGGSCRVLRRAWRAWQELRAPYEAARVRLLMARACRQLGDHDTAEMELDAARRVFEDLAAAPALAEVAALTGPAAAPGGLTAREQEVLRCVASGASNREIADTLVISEHTVRRHLQNIFAKLQVGTRTAAAAYAHQHGLA